MAQYQTEHVGDQAIGSDAGTGLSFKDAAGVYHPVRATTVEDDRVSTTNLERSAIAKARAINESTSAHGVFAQVLPTVARVTISAEINIDAVNHFYINYVQILGDFSAMPGSNLLLTLINENTANHGVSAQYDTDGTLVLTAIDGRNIQILGG